VHSQLVQQPAQASAQQLVQALVQQLVLVPALRQELLLVLERFQLHLQLQSQFLLQQCHLREHEFR
jgi:hypothetical protein